MPGSRLCAALVVAAAMALVACVQDSESVRARVQTRLARAEVTATLPPPPVATATPQPVRSYTVGNTGGDGVYIRRTTRLADRIMAWPDGTRMESQFDEQQSEGRVWRKVRDPRGNVGWVPAEYLVAVREAGPQPTVGPASPELQELYRRVPDARSARAQLGLDLFVFDFGRGAQVQPRVEAQLLDWYLDTAPGRERYELRVRAGADADGQPIERIWRWEVAGRVLRLAETAPPGAPPFACWRWDGMTADAIRQASLRADGWGPGVKDLDWCGIAPPSPTPSPTPDRPAATPTPRPGAAATPTASPGGAAPSPVASAAAATPTATPRP
ncbi:MAG: hypothetical protein HY691_03340 [Chloroflexi bacterium]|nr:hypothetical protein [Chloroflexota bacterium]